MEETEERDGAEQQGQVRVGEERTRQEREKKAGKVKENRENGIRNTQPGKKYVAKVCMKV